MNRLLKYLLSFQLIAVLLATVVSCNNPSKKLEEAQRILEEHPDSAYLVLREVDYADFDNDSLQAKYIVTKAKANIGVGRSLITDTMLVDAASYYLESGDTANWISATQLLSNYDYYVKGDIVSSLQRIDTMQSLISNDEMLQRIYEHGLEISLQAQDYQRAYVCADWLSQHNKDPEQILSFVSVKGAAEFMQGNVHRSLELYDSIIGSDIASKVPLEVFNDFLCDYAEILDGCGRSKEALALMIRIEQNGYKPNDFEEVGRLISKAQFYANSGDLSMASEVLDSINFDATISVFETYTYQAMLKAAIEFKETGRLPLWLMHKASKAVSRNYVQRQIDVQTAMESVIELNEDKYRLQLQKQRLWLTISFVLLILVTGGVVVYFVLNHRKQRLIEAEERVETLSQMLKDAEVAEREETASSSNDRLKAALLRQLGILKTFAGAPTPQNCEALKKIANGVDSLVDWDDFYRLTDELFDGFYTNLVNVFPDVFNNKEIQIIMLIKARFSTKEISVLTEQSSATIYVRKTSIRKKLRTDDGGDFIEQLDILFSTKMSD